MRIQISILLAAVIGLGVLAVQQATMIREQQIQLVAANDRSKVEALGLQAKCAQQAKAEWAEMGYKANDMATYRNHYNTRLNRCFMHFESRIITDGVGWDNRSVVDAFEHVGYASYMWKTVPDKKFADVPPVICTVQKASGEEQVCQSRDEFDNLIKAYMEG